MTKQAIHTIAKGIEEAVDLGPVESVPLGEGRVYCLTGRTLAIFRPREGGLFALDNACPHCGGALADGVVGPGSVICPLHGRKFELASGRCHDAGAAVRSYEVFLVEGRILLLV